MPKGDKLSPKQQLFVAEYLKDKNGTRAYLKVFGAKNERCASVLACKLLAKGNIKTAVEAGLARVIQKAELSAQLVLEELRSIGFVKLKDAFDEDGNLLSPHEMPEAMQVALGSIEVEEKRVKGVLVSKTKKVKPCDKIKALELIGKHLKMWTDVSENKNTHEIAATPEQIKDEVKKFKDGLK